MKPNYVEPNGYFNKEMQKILDKGKTSKNEKATKSATKKTNTKKK